jgi:hypothetical protein
MYIGPSYGYSSVSREMPYLPGMRIVTDVLSAVVVTFTQTSFALVDLGKCVVISRPEKESPS